MEMKIFLLPFLLLLLMEISFKATALAFHRSAVIKASTSSQPISPSHPYSTKLPNNTSSHHHNNKRLQGRNKKPHHHNWIPAKAANPHHHQSIAVPPSVSPSQDPAENRARGPVSSTPYISYHHHPPRSTQQGPSLSPFQQPTLPSSRIPSPASSAPALSPSSSSSAHSNVVIFSPLVSPLGSIRGSTKASPPLPILALPPPPPNTDCSSVTCTEPLTYTTTGSPCGCVLPIQVKLHLDVAIYAFFPLVSELAEEIAAGVGLNHSQVRIMGADAASQQLEKTAVLVNLVPRGGRFDYITAFRIYDKFWRRQVLIKDSLFGDYEVLYVHYPGLPPSPPPAPLGISATDDGPYSGQDDHGNPMKPLGVNIAAKTKRDGPGKRMIVVIIVSSFTAFVILLALSWLLLAKFKSRRDDTTDNILIPTPPKPTKTAIPARTTPQGGGSSAVESVSLSSGTMTYAGSAKIFTLSEMERATDRFAAARVVGEGGFGLVYSGALDDGRKVAVKVLKRDSGGGGGGREFLAEVEMLSRLHHRNLVKLIGICTEGQARCLVYELVPNGSLECHLHGVDKEGDPLDWDARMKIALGAARGLAYLHEDSNPRVIHRDFKSSNILLEHDFTPKVSDFGLARSALEGNTHISTHVMGTFGYLAPEYAMTGHLLVKSDVYSYGVVLLELLTGRKPVDLSQPPGQENLVAWVRPLLTNKEALETILDPSLTPPADPTTVAKVAAIASMCVQPEVAHRPFMGEVVQALKLVCNEFDEASKGLASASRVYSSRDYRTSSASSTTMARAEIIALSQARDNNSNNDDNNNGALLIMSTSELMSAATMGTTGRQDLGSFRRHSSSGPLVSSDGQKRRFWQRLRSLSWGSVGEHGLPKIWSASR